MYLPLSLPIPLLVSVGFVPKKPRKKGTFRGAFNNYHKKPFGGPNCFL